MFGWFKKKSEKKGKVGPEEILDGEIEGLVSASIKYVVGVDGTVYVQFFWDSDSKDDANEDFANLFSQVNSGDLFESTIGFIEETLRDNGQEDEFALFFSKVLQNQQAKVEPILNAIKTDLLAGIDKSDDEVVVKPTDVGQMPFKGNQT
tara:strand:+ start:3451 stop:3897 length:447 start_codon:yes stop_codon:yes gene_type:complete